MQLILASASPRRAELLAAAGFSFDTLAIDIDEAVRPDEHPADYVRRLAVEKAARAHAMLAEQAAQIRASGHRRSGLTGPSGLTQGEPLLSQDFVVLGADTTVVVGGDVLVKPRDAADAERMLRRLSGRRHEVLTGVSLRRNQRELGGVETTAVDFVVVSEADIDWYRDSGEWRDKAGGYAIQGLASRFIARIEGSYTNVVGLPVCAVCGWLQRLASAE